MASSAATLGLRAGMAAAADAAPPAEVKDAPLPCGKIGDLSVSRVLLGGNLLTHYTHSRDLQYVYNLAAHYNTDAKILETLAIAEKNGVNTLSVHTVPRVIDLLRKYRREQGGKMQWIICPTPDVDKEWDEYVKSVRELAENGTDAIYLWGVNADRLLGQGKVELIAKAVDVVKEYGIPSGVGAHDLNVIIECEKRKVKADFYIKTFHHHNYLSAPKPEEIKGAYNEVPGYWCRDPQEVIDVMKDVEKPWIAFKVMAAGAIAPKDAFEYVYKSGADHLLAGMFDFEIADDVAVAKKALADVKRDRPWRS
jgi:hypothetical protein